MKLSAIFSVFSVATGVLAAPADNLVQGPAKRPVGGPFSRDKTPGFSGKSVQSPWGGSVQEGNGWRTVTGSTVIPEVSGQSPSAGAAAWVGIDGKFAFLYCDFHHCQQLARTYSHEISR